MEGRRSDESDEQSTESGIERAEELFRRIRLEPESEDDAPTDECPQAVFFVDFEILIIDRLSPFLFADRRVAMKALRSFIEQVFAAFGAIESA